MRPAELDEDMDLSAKLWARLARAFREHYGMREPLDRELHASMLVWSFNTVPGRLAYTKALVEVIQEARIPPDA